MTNIIPIASVTFDVNHSGGKIARSQYDLCGMELLFFDNLREYFQSKCRLERRLHTSHHQSEKGMLVIKLTIS